MGHHFWRYTVSVWYVKRAIGWHWKESQLSANSKLTDWADMCESHVPQRSE